MAVIRIIEFARQYKAWRVMYGPLKAARVAWFVSAYTDPNF